MDKQYIVDTRAALHAAIGTVVPTGELVRALCAANILLCTIEAGIPLDDEERDVTVASLVALLRVIHSDGLGNSGADNDLELLISVFESALTEGGVH